MENYSAVGLMVCWGDIDNRGIQRTTQAQASRPSTGKLGHFHMPYLMLAVIFRADDDSDDSVQHRAHQANQVINIRGGEDYMACQSQ